MCYSHLKGIRTKRKNELLVQVFEKGLSIEDLFDHDLINTEFDLNDKEKDILINSESEISSYSFLAEELMDQGFKIIPLNSSDYPPILKSNLKLSHSPQLVYVKGNTQIFKEDSIAIVGSRKASEISLQFTHNIAVKAASEFKVVSSGFAKGVDQAALDNTLEAKGRSIIVLPQGILTFGSKIKKYYSQIQEGDVTILSTFHPKAPWSVQLAMARNPIIYGLAKEIYVAESGSDGGTWNGVIDGLRKGRKIYVRQADPKEKNANNTLIEKGATPVDMNGLILAEAVVSETKESYSGQQSLF